MLELLNNPYILGGLGFILCIILLMIIFAFKKKPKREVIKPLDASFMNQLLLALGNSDNLKAVSHEHQRLKVVVKDVKKVQANLLKTLESPAVLKGKELTLLIKHHTKDVVHFLKGHVREES